MILVLWNAAALGQLHAREAAALRMQKPQSSAASSGMAAHIVGRAPFAEGVGRGKRRRLLLLRGAGQRWRVWRGPALRRMLLQGGQQQQPRAAAGRGSLRMHQRSNTVSQ